VEEYFKVNLFIPLVDGYIKHLQDQFGPTQAKTLSLGHLIPAYIGTFDQIKPSVQFFHAFVTEEEVEGEFEVWKQKWKDPTVASIVKTALQALERCSELCMPNIHKLLQILVTLPVTTAEPERIFSKVERVATKARGHMTEERLEVIVLLSAHRSLTPAVTRVIDRCAESRARRIKLLL